MKYKFVIFINIFSWSGKRDKEPLKKLETAQKHGGHNISPYNKENTG